MNASRPSASRESAFCLQLPFDYILGGNASMVHAGHPERIASLHTSPADQNILKGIIQRMADMERTGHVRRWDHDGIGLSGIGRVGVKQPGVDPVLIPAIFDVMRAIGLIELWSGHSLRRMLEKPVGVVRLADQLNVQ